MDTQCKTSEIIKEIVLKVMAAAEIPDSGQLIEELMEQGFQLRDINAALELILALPEIITPGECFRRFARQAKAQRVLGQMEMCKLAVNAQGFLYDVIASDLLTSEEVELVLNTCMRMNVPEIGVVELKWIMDNVVTDVGRLLLIHSIETAEPGKRNGSFVN